MGTLCGHTVGVIVGLLVGDALRRVPRARRGRRMSYTERGEARQTRARLFEREFRVGASQRRLHHQIQRNDV